MDDSQADLDAQKRTFDQCKLLNEVHLFKSGASFLDHLRSVRAARVPARFIIFLDLLMRPENGVAILRQLRAEKLAEDSMLVMLSGLTDVKMLHEGYQLGAHTFLVKPLQVQDVMELVSSLKQSISVVAEQSGNRLVWQKTAGQTKAKVVG